MAANGNGSHASPAKSALSAVGSTPAKSDGAPVFDDALSAGGLDIHCPEIPEDGAAGIRTPVNNIEYFPPNFEGLVLGCIDADFCK